MGDIYEKFRDKKKTVEAIYQWHAEVQELEGGFVFFLQLKFHLVVFGNSGNTVLACSDFTFLFR